MTRTILSTDRSRARRAAAAVFVTAFATVLATLLAGCDAQERRTTGPAAREPGAAHEGHVHVAPHGGSLVELEHEALHVELLVDPSAGTLDAWVLDGECENAVRIAQESVELTLVLGGTAVAVRLDAVENPLTGEKQGDTSQFRGAHDGLRGAGEFDGTLRSVRIGPRSFADVKFRYARSPK